MVPPFREVFEANVRYVWRALVHFGVPLRDVDDVCQEVFVVVHRRLDQCEDPSRLRAWLYGICWRVAAGHIRRAQNKREVPTADPAADVVYGHEPSQDLEARRRLERLEGALSALVEEQRAVFVLYEIEQFTMREIADIVGCSINTAFSRLYASRRRVTEELGVEFPEEVWKR